MQEHMFAEARQEMEKDFANGIYNGFMPASRSMFMDDAQRRSMMEQQIEERAAMLAEQFVSKQDGAVEVSKEQAHMVYKILNTPAEMLIANMSSMQPQILIQFYRKLAIQLHPDKNGHPQATDAFQVV